MYYKTYSTFSSKFGYYIEDLFVLPKYRNKGVGTELLIHVIAKGRNDGFNKVEWYVNNKNTKAVEFYNKIGAKKLDYKSIFYIQLETLA